MQSKFQEAFVKLKAKEIKNFVLKADSTEIETDV